MVDAEDAIDRSSYSHPRLLQLVNQTTSEVIWAEAYRVHPDMLGNRWGFAFEVLANRSAVASFLKSYKSGLVMG
jgi:hypothetical protein